MGVETLVSQLVDVGSNVVYLVRDWVPQNEGVHNRRMSMSTPCAAILPTAICWSVRSAMGMVLANASFLAKIAVQRFNGFQSDDRGDQSPQKRD